MFLKATVILENLKITVMVEIIQTGRCNCGKIKFKLSGTVRMNGYCHCKACAAGQSQSPVHIIGVSSSDFEIIEGSDSLSVGNGMGSMRHGFCKHCGSSVYQHPDGADFKATFPATYHIQDASGPGCKLPSEYLPQAHINYENRLMDSTDSLPKFKVWPSGERVENDGTPVK